MKNITLTRLDQNDGMEERSDRDILLFLAKEVLDLKRKLRELLKK